MTKVIIRQAIINYMDDIMHSPPKNWKTQWKKVIDETTEVLDGKFKTPEEVDQYLGFILEYIDGLNRFFAKKKMGRIPYSKLLHHAKKPEKITDFMFDMGAKKKLSKESDDVDVNPDITLAGFRFRDGDNTKELSIVVFKENVYHYIYSNKVNMFYFLDGEVIVRDSLGKIRTYKAYKARAIRKNKMYTKLLTIYKSIEVITKKTDSMGDFLAHYEDM